MSSSVWFRTDEAWDFLSGELEAEFGVVDVGEEAKGLRFITTSSRIEAFAEQHAGKFRPYTLFGSGDFHHLSAVWMRQFEEPFQVVSFDNHPDWDIRPPRWSCGAWINRALENRLIEGVGIWGCGNFECQFPGRLLGNRAAARAGRLVVHPWEREGARYPAWLHPMTSETWKAQFSGWVEQRAGARLYVTIDMDCLSSAEAVTNWESGRFTCDDLVWALRTLHEKTAMIGGDLCGAWSRPIYATRFQRLAGWFDHPATVPVDEEERIARNRAAFKRLWPALRFGGSDLI
jgi:arginase family enzyme